MPALSQQQLGKIFRPVGPKQVSVGNAWTSGGSFSLAQGVDLSLPIRGLRFVLKGRIAVATANYTSVNPEGILNMLRRILVTGTNARQGGNVTLVDTSGANAFLLNSLFRPQGNLFIINNVQRPNPGTPYITSATATAENSSFLGTTAASPYDFRLAIDVPFHPHHCPALFQPGFGVRQQEWRQSVQIQVTYGTQADNADGCLGVSAATTATTFTAFGSGSGSPTLDVYALPYEMGLDVDPLVTPGVLSRVDFPITTILQSAGTNVQLGILQPVDTTRVFLKVGTSTTNPYFATLSDTNVTALGILVGGNRVVRENDDIFAHKNDEVSYYGRWPIQGLNVMDFYQSGSPWSAYPISSGGQGTLFTLQGNVAGVANAFGTIIQEQILYYPSGSLYTG